MKIEILLTQRQKTIHENALTCAATFTRSESNLIEILIQVEQAKVRQAFGFSSLYKYALSELKLSEANAYIFSSVAKKCNQCGPLRRAIQEQVLSVSKAARMVSTITSSNAIEFVEFAKTHTSRQIDKEAARLNPKRKERDKVTPISEAWVKLTCNLSPDVLALLERSQSVASTLSGLPADIIDTLRAALGEFLKRHDPVAKAERATVRKGRQRDVQASEAANYPTSTTVPIVDNTEILLEQKDRFTQNDSSKTNTPMRTRLTAEQKHAAHTRDKGCCTFIRPTTGKRCNEDRWLEIHHVNAVAEGGGNELGNLTTLCAAHHDLVHQLSLPINGQVSWLRSPTVPYNAVYRSIVEYA